MADFKADVLSWVRERIDDRAVEVELVDAFGSDWAGGTEPGFYSECNIDLRYRRDDGTLQFHQIEGSELGDLWKWVINGWESHVRKL